MSHIILCSSPFFWPHVRYCYAFLVLLLLAAALCRVAPLHAASHTQSSASPLPHLTVLTEEFPPYSYTENGTIIGLATEVVTHLLEKAQLSYTIKVYPWKRALVTAQTTPDTLLFSANKTPARRPYFEWIGPIAPEGTQLFRLRNSGGTIRMLEDIKRYSLGLVRGYSSEEFFRQKGFQENVHFILAPTIEQCFKMLIHKRVDLIPANNFIITHYKSAFKLDDLEFENAFTVFPNKGLFLAVNKNTDPRVITRLNAAFAHMQADGVVDSIVYRYYQ